MKTKTREPMHTKGPWVNGYGNGVTGPTSAVSAPTVHEAVELNAWFKDTTKPHPKEKHTIVSKDMQTIAIIPCINEEEGQANARLIAAAPDLLEACKWASQSFHHPHCKTVKDRVDTGQNCNCHVGACKAAIAKAKGI
jgi:hypothetical protein